MPRWPLPLALPLATCDGAFAIRRCRCTLAIGVAVGGGGLGGGTKTKRRRMGTRPIPEKYVAKSHCCVLGVLPQAEASSAKRRRQGRPQGQAALAHRTSRGTGSTWGRELLAGRPKGRQTRLIQSTSTIVYHQHTTVRLSVCCTCLFTTQDLTTAHSIDSTPLLKCKRVS